MKGITTKLILIPALIIACLLPGLTLADQGHHQSGIIGRVQVEQVGLPHLWKVRLSTDTYKLVEDIQTDADGQFVVNLKPGTYHLTPYLSDGGGAVLLGPSVQVTVEKKDFVVVEMSLIFGPM